MERKTESREWTLYEFREREFKEKLGIEDPRHILSVTVTYGGKIVVRMMSKS